MQISQRPTRTVKRYRSPTNHRRVRYRYDGDRGTLFAGIQTFNVTPMQVGQAIVIFLGIPFFGGFFNRYVGIRVKGGEW